MHSERTSLKLTALALAFIGLIAFFANTYCSKALGYTALFSAGVASPQTALRIIRRDFSADEKPSEAHVSLTAPAEEPLKPAPPQTASAVSDLQYTTPSDILKMSQEYKEVYSSASHDGEIVEKQYSAANATSTFGIIAVRNTTPSHSINIEASLNEPLELHIEDKTKPTVLIFHTHTTEAYEFIDEGWFTNSYSTRSKDPKRNMVRVGDAICEELEKAGIGVIHDTEIHDLKYTGAYDHSRAEITRILKENPSIQIVIDVHRDAIHNSDTKRTKPVTVINGKKAAQVMIIAGCEDGRVTSFPGWEKNLTFDLRFQKTAETMFPTLMRPVLFSGRKYNMDLLPCSALFEFGSDSNTLEEAVYSGHLIGQALACFVNENTGG